MKNKKKILLVLIPIVLILVLAVVFFALKPKATKGSKSVEIDVVNDAGETVTYEINTDAEFLRQAMDEADGLTYFGDETDYGLLVYEVNGVNADYSVDQSYWAFYVNDEYCNYGVDEQPVADGDVFRIEYTK